MSWNSNKNSVYLKLWWASRLVILINVPGGSYILRTGNIFVWDPLRSHPVCLFIWLVLICVLYDKIIILSIMLSWILWVILANYRTWGGSGKLQICRRLVRSVSGLRTLELAAGVWSEGYVVEHCALDLWNLTQLHIISVRTAWQIYAQKTWAPRRNAKRGECTEKVQEAHREKHVTQPFL